MQEGVRGAGGAGGVGGGAVAKADWPVSTPVHVEAMAGGQGKGRGWNLS